MRNALCCLCINFVLLASQLLGDGPSDNKEDFVRPIPPPGIVISEDQRSKLVAEVQSLKLKVANLQLLVSAKGASSERIDRYLPDVEIFSRAVDLALNEDGFFDPKDCDRAIEVLAEGHRRADALLSNNVDWTALPLEGKPTVRGYRSRLDGSVQPYGVVSSLRELVATGEHLRTDVWCRGRSEKSLELQFIATRLVSSDPKPAPGVVMIHPFGRYCNANKLAGEVDTLEAIEHAVSEYALDKDRIAIRGFSMGGAAAWHLAVHYPSKWFAANPGAGFSETPKFLKVFQSEDLQPAWYEQKLWQMHDCPLWACNLRNLPTIAYSGELDKQKQAADVMAEACWNLPVKERFELTHIVAPNTAHSITPAAYQEIEQKLSAIDKHGREKIPNEVYFTTPTLKYHQSYWITVEALKEHWVPAKVHARIVNAEKVAEANQLSIFIQQENVTALSLHFPVEFNPNSNTMQVLISDRVRDPFDPPLSLLVSRASDRTWQARMQQEGEAWILSSPLPTQDQQLVKKHGLQGPIDDAFMDSFLFVKPSRAGKHADVDKWVTGEFDRAVAEWHRQVRGDVRIKASEELQATDIQNHHLILWGDLDSNPTIAKIADRLPVRWTESEVLVGKKAYPRENHAPILIYPNPLNPKRYVVLNSGFTYREYDYLNNARQVPKLPDWAIIDLKTPPNSRWPGKIEDAGFFDEAWQIKPF